MLPPECSPPCYGSERLRTPRLDRHHNSEGTPRIDRHHNSGSLVGSPRSARPYSAVYPSYNTIGSHDYNTIRSLDYNTINSADCSRIRSSDFKRTYSCYYSPKVDTGVRNLNRFSSFELRNSVSSPLTRGASCPLDCSDRVDCSTPKSFTTSPKSTKYAELDWVRCARLNRRDSYGSAINGSVSGNCDSPSSDTIGKPSNKWGSPCARSGKWGSPNTEPGCWESSPRVKELGRVVSCKNLMNKRNYRGRAEQQKVYRVSKDNEMVFGNYSDVGPYMGSLNRRDKRRRPEKRDSFLFSPKRDSTVFSSANSLSSQCGLRRANTICTSGDVNAYLRNKCNRDSALSQGSETMSCKRNSKSTFDSGFESGLSDILDEILGATQYDTVMEESPKSKWASFKGKLSDTFVKSKRAEINDAMSDSSDLKMTRWTKLQQFVRFRLAKVSQHDLDMGGFEDAHWRSLEPRQFHRGTRRTQSFVKWKTPRER